VEKNWFKIDLGGTGAKTYEGLIKLFLDVFSYSVIKKNYDHNIDESIYFVEKCWIVTLNNGMFNIPHLLKK
jgi:hypothetical protein